ncbi:MAG: YARHG domain-containing protein, partial [Lachnospiraceae bacterium]
YIEYALYDMDQDGYAELLIQKGSCNADMAYEIYTTDGQNAVYVGEALGMAQEIYAAPEKKGFYTYFSRQMVDTINLISLADGKMTVEDVFNGENVGFTNSYDELDKKIVTRYLGDGMIWEESEVMEQSVEENEYVFPDSDKTYLTEDEVRNMNDELLLYGRNEIYARHGYIFKDEQIRQHFENTSWYVGTVAGDQFDPAVFNEYENANLELILRIEKERADGITQQKYDFAGEYIDGTGDDYTYIVITQNGNTISYDWYSGDVYQSSGYDLPINADGTVDMGGGSIWLEDDVTLKYSLGAGGSDNIWTFWKVR